MAVNNNILLLQKQKSEISSLTNLNQNLHGAKQILHLIKHSLVEKPTHILSLPPSLFLDRKPLKTQICLKQLWTSPPGVPWPHPWALLGYLLAGWSPSSCGCGCVLSGWGFQRCPGLELCWGTSFTGRRGATGLQAEGVGEPSRGPCLWLLGASVLLIQTRAPATQEDLNILKTPGQPKHLASPAHSAQVHTLTSIPSGRYLQKW